MSLNKRIIIFVFILVVVPMVILFFISDFIFKIHVENAAQSYLENALKLARNQMISRMQETENMCKTAVKSTNLTQTIHDLKDTYDYLDYIIFIDEKNNVSVSIPAVIDPNFSRLQKLIERARKTSNTVVSEEVVKLEELYSQNSEQYADFRIKLSKTFQNKYPELYLTKCLTFVCITPAFNKDNQYIGSLVVGDIVNNDKYFPEVYSKNIEHSFLSISIDGIRITSNIRSPQKGNFIGSPIPITMDTLEGPKASYFGRVNLDNEIHVFLDEPILNCDGDIIGALGVGIPEQKFSIIKNTNRNVIINVTIICLLVMLIVSRYLANKASEPIIKATELAEQISKGNKDFVIDERLLKSDKSETTILLKTFQKMAEDLRESEEERRKYLEKLKQLNEELEERVRARTQDLRQAILVLKKAGEVKSRFLANMSHELRTPLNAIISSSEAIKEEIFGPLNEKQKKHIQNTLKSSTHLLQLINDILDISKIEAGKMTLSLGDYSISSIVLESVNIISSLAFRKNIDISINVVPSDFTIKVDAKKLKQILYNLLSNAVKFTPENGNVSIEVFKDKGFMQINVKDNGIGIKEEDQERVFREFEQVDGSYEREYEGTGLGLPLTKKLVEMHGGDIYLLSKIGEGTEVIITLPIDLDGKLPSKEDEDGKDFDCR